MSNSPEHWSLERSIISERLKNFVAEKVAQVRAAAKVDGREIFPEFEALFAAAEKGDWQMIGALYAEICQGFQEVEKTGSEARLVQPIDWATVSEIWGAFGQFAEGEEKYSVAFGKELIASIPPGSIYFGGTDPGRFVITALCNSHVNADPFFTLTQNALVDRGYLHYVRGMYGPRIYIPTDEDLANALDEYRESARRRLKEGKIRPGEDVKEVEGKVQFGGVISIMAINGLVSKLVFDKNPDRECYVEEGFPLDWMHPHLSPHGLIMKINRQPLTELSDEVIQKDHDFWTRYVQPMIGDWLNTGTTVSEIAAFIEKVQVNHDLSEFKGDPRFVQNVHSQRLFSKLRSSIGGIYERRLGHARSPDQRERMLNEADFAYRQAFALAPSNPEAVFRYASLRVGEKRFDDAILAVEIAVKLGVENAVLPAFLEQLKEMKRK